MSNSPNLPNDDSRQARVRAVVDDYLRRRGAGEAVTPDSFIAANGDLASELEPEFRKIAVIDRAGEQAAGGAPTHPSPPSPLSSPRGEWGRGEGSGAFVDQADTPFKTTPTDDSVPSPAETPSPSSGSLPNRKPGYELLGLIGRGGMGVVHKARQLSLNRIVALKLTLPRHFTDDAEVERFHREAELAARLQHPNIVRVYEIGEHDGQHFYAMDYVEGTTLAQLTRDHPLPGDTAAWYMQTVAEAVDYAHQHGVLHRDLKPSNILIDKSDQPRVTDFGLAKRFEAGTDESGSGVVGMSPLARTRNI